MTTGYDPHARTWILGTPYYPKTEKLMETLKFHTFSSEDVRRAFSKSPQFRMQRILVDARYRALSLADWKAVIAATTDSWKKYTAEFFDCDDFARCQSALVSLHYDCNGCGQVYDESGKHSYNVILVSGGASLSTRIVEPQSGKILDRDEVGKAPYTETKGFIII